MKYLIVVAVMMIAVNVNAYEFAENWTVKDTAYQVTFLTATTADWATTHWGAKNNWVWHGHKHRETCPFLSDHPTAGEVDAYFPAVMVLHTLIALALPPEAKVFDFKINPRRIWQCVWIVTEVGYVGNNIGAGMRIEF